MSTEARSRNADCVRGTTLRALCWITLIASVFGAVHCSTPPESNSGAGASSRVSYVHAVGASIPIRCVYSRHAALESWADNQLDQVHWVPLGTPLQLLPDRGDVSVWALADGRWLLSRIASSGDSHLEEAAGEYEEFFLDVEVQDHSGSGPIPRARVQLIAGRHGTPTWDTMTGYTDTSGRVSLGPFSVRPEVVDRWWIDVSARGFAPIRVTAPIFETWDRGRGPGRCVLARATERTGRVMLDGSAPPEGTVVGVRIPELSPSCELFTPVSADGAFQTTEPIGLTVMYKVLLADGRISKFRRIGGGEEGLRFELE